MTTTRGLAISVIACASLALCSATTAVASVHTWTGPTNGLWSNAANWSGGSKPTSGEPGGTIVKFGSNTTSTMDISGLTIDQIQFTGSNNTVNGSTALTVNGALLAVNVASEGENNVLGASLPLTLTGASLEATSANGMLTMAGPIGGTVGLVIGGGGGEFDMTGENTFSGATLIASGKLHIATPLGAVIAGASLTIGNGFGAPGAAELVMDNSADLSNETAVTVNSDGVMNFNGHADQAKSLSVFSGTVLGATLVTSGTLTVHEGKVGIAGTLFASALEMTGGSISGPGALDLSGNIRAASGISGSAAVSSAVWLNASPVVTVASGTAPELSISGPISEIGGSRSITEAGSGSLLTSGTNTYTGTTTVSSGTFIADGTQTGPFVVNPNGTLEGSGSVGATVVEGVLAPTAPGLRTGSLAFGPAGRLDDTIHSAAVGSIPSTIVTGTVAINPSAALDLVFSPGLALPHGSEVPLIENDGSDPIEGHFSGVPSGSVLSTFEGVPLLANYGGGDGNDLTLTAGNVPPSAGSIAATPNPVEAGRAVAMSLAASDVNRDPLTTTWNFGDGTGGSGTSVTHAYAKAGTYTVVATVSDGLVQVQSTSVVAVTERVRTSSPPRATEGPGAGASPTASASAFGTAFGLTVARTCLRPGASFTATLAVARMKGKLSRGSLRKVAKVVFTVGGKSPKTARHAPFSAHLTVPRLPSGAAAKVSAVAHVVLRNGKHATKSITAVIKIC